MLSSNKSFRRHDHRSLEKVAVTPTFSLADLLQVTEEVTL